MEWTSPMTIPMVEKSKNLESQFSVYVTLSHSVKDTRPFKDS